MYPTLYHAFYDLFGFDWPWAKMLNSFGFFVALAFVAASYTLGLELKRKQAKGIFPFEKKKIVSGLPPQWGDIAGNAAIGFLFGWKIVYLLVNSGELFQTAGAPQRHIFSAEGNLWLGLLLGAAFGYWRYRDYAKKQLPTPLTEEVLVPATDYNGTITFIAAIGGLAGAKLFHLLENPNEFKEFFTSFSLENFISGLTVYGGLIVGAIAVLTWAWRKKWPLLELCDAATPGMILAYGIGRIGCQVSGDGDWGEVNPAPAPSWIPDWLWSYTYPHNVLSDGIPMAECDPHFAGYCNELPYGVFPTPLYETIMAIVIFAVLWSLRKRWKVAGKTTALYLVLNGIERMSIEPIRVNNRAPFLGIEVTQAEVIAALCILGGLVLWWWTSRRKTAENAV